MANDYAHLLETLEILDKRSQMLLLKKDYWELVSFLNGYLHALSHESNLELSQLFSNWVAKKSNNVFWGSYVYARIANCDDEIAYGLLILNVKEFVISLTDGENHTS